MSAESAKPMPVKIHGPDYADLQRFRAVRCLSAADAVGVAIQIAKKSPAASVDEAVREYGQRRNAPPRSRNTRRPSRAAATA